jgi:hypothetical protein
MDLLEARIRLHFNQHSGLSDCFSGAMRQKMLDLLHQLSQKIGILKAGLRELGLEAFGNITGSMLGLEKQHSKVVDGKEPHKFLEFANLWGEMDYSYANVSIFLPPRVYSDKKGMDDLVIMLRQQLASTARVEPQLVDLVSIACDPSEEKTGMQGKALIKFMGHATGLEVTILAGKYWPCADSSNTAAAVVGVKLGPGRRINAKGIKNASKASRVADLGHLARKMQESQQLTGVRAGYMNMVNPKFDDERFKLMIYVPDQVLLVTAYEDDKGLHTVLGEVFLKVDDIVSECRLCPGLQFSRTYGLVKNLGKPVFYQESKEGINKVRQSEIVLQFKVFTLATKQATSKMAESVMKEASKHDSALRAGCIVTGPAFLDEGASWETLRIYVCSDYFEMRPEREYLGKYVFPALACQCLTLKLHFQWIDLSAYGRDGTRDDIAKRIHAIHQSTIRGYDMKGRLKESHLVLCLVGEKRGRVLDARDIRRAHGAAPTPGMYDWVITGAKRGMSVLEMEMKAAIFNSIERCDPIICIRNPAFLDNEELVATVPKAVRARFMESSLVDRAKMVDLKENISSKMPSKIIRYKPTFSHFMPEEAGDENCDAGNPPRLSVFASTDGDSCKARPEGNPDVRVDEMSPKEVDGKICLKSLERFGLSVYERIWDIICQRYSFSRSRTRTNLYGEEVQYQAAEVKALYKTQHQVLGGTQESVVQTLNDATDFANIDSGDIIYLMGLHGCGMSTLLARFIVERDLIDVQDSFDDCHTDDGQLRLKKYARRVIHIRRLTGSAKSTEDHEKKKESSWVKIRHSAALTLWNAISHELPDTANITVVNVGYEENANASPRHNALHQKISRLPTANKEDQEVLEKLLSCIRTLEARKVPVAEISMRLMPPRCIFFFKREMHTTRHMLSYLCSSLLPRNDSMAPSWRHFEEILRQTTSSADLSQPVLLILDGIDNEERQEIRKIVSKFQGRVRALMSIDKLALQNDDRPAYEGLRKYLTVVNVPDLGHEERKEIFDVLIRRIGPKKKPENLTVITDRPVAGSPLYLQTIAAYFAAGIVLSMRPQPMMSLNNTVEDVIEKDFLPMLECRVGEDYVRAFADIMIFSKRGNESKDINAMMQSFGVPLSESNLRLLMEAFRPFADTVSTMSEDHMSMTRMSLRVACQRRYAVSTMHICIESGGKGLFLAKF